MDDFLLTYKTEISAAMISLIVTICTLIRGIIRMCEQVAASGNTLILYSA